MATNVLHLTTGVVYLRGAITLTGAISSPTITATTNFVVGAATTAGVRLDLESGELAVREGDDSDYAALRANYFTFKNGSLIDDGDGDGVIKMRSSSGSDFGRLVLGNATSSFPALKRSSAELQVRLGDDSAYAALATSNLTVNGLIDLVTSSAAIRGIEISDPSAPAANTGILYFRDNGASKTQLVARFPTGAVQVIATEP